MTEEIKPVTRPDIDLNDNDELLRFTIGSRLDVHAALTSNGTPAPGEVLDVVLKNLSAIEGVAVGRLRIKTEEKANELNQNMQSTLLAGVMSRIREVNVFEHSTPVQRTIPTIPDNLDIEPIPGQMADNRTRQEEDIDSFMQRFAADE